MNKKISLVMAVILTLVSVVVPLMGGGVDKEIKASGMPDYSNGVLINPLNFKPVQIQSESVCRKLDGNYFLCRDFKHRGRITIEANPGGVMYYRVIRNNKIIVNGFITQESKTGDYNLMPAIKMGDRIDLYHNPDSSLGEFDIQKIYTEDYQLNQLEFEGSKRDLNDNISMNLGAQAAGKNYGSVYFSIDKIESKPYERKYNIDFTIDNCNGNKKCEYPFILSDMTVKPNNTNFVYSHAEGGNINESWISDYMYSGPSFHHIDIIKIKANHIIPDSGDPWMDGKEVAKTDFDNPGGSSGDVSKLTQQILNLTNQIVELNKQITQLKADLATKTTENQTLTQEKAALQTKLDEALAKLKKIEEGLDKAKNLGLVDGTDPSANIKTLVDKINSLQTEVNNYKNKIKELQAEIGRLKDRNKELEDLFDGLVVPEGPWTVPTEVPQGYTIKGLENPINNASETRTIEIVSTKDKELTIDNFDIVITNPLKSPRTVYSSIVWLGAGHIEGKNDKQLLNSTKYNLTVNKGDRVELRVKSIPYTIDKKSDSKETKTTENNPQKSVYIPGSVEIDYDCVALRCSRGAASVCARAHERGTPEYEECVDEKEIECTDIRENKNLHGRTIDPNDRCAKGSSSGHYSTTPQGTYTLTTTTTTDTYTISDIDARVKAIEISGKDLGLKSNGTSKFEYTNSYVSKKVSSGKKDANGNAADINETPGMGTPNYKTNITNPEYSLESTAKEPKEIQVIKQPAGTVAEKFTIQPGETKDLAAYKDSDTKVESLSEPKAPSVADQLINLKKQVEDLEKKLAECEGKCSSSTELDKCNADKAALEKEVETIREKIVKVIDGVEADNITDAANALLRKVSDLEAKIKDLEAKLAAKEKELQDEKNKNTQLQKQITDLNGKIDEAKKDIDKLNKEKKAADEKIKNLNGQIEDLVKETKNLKKELENQKTGSEAQIKDLEKKIQDKESEIAKLKNIISENEEEIKYYKGKMNELIEQIANMNESVRQAQDTFDQYKAEIENKKSDIKRYDKAIEETKAAIKEAEEAIKQLEKAENPDKEQIESIKEQIKEFENNIKNDQQIKLETEESIKETEDKLDKLEKDIQAILEGDYEKLKEALEKAKKDFNDLKKSLNKAQKENENLRAELEKEKGLTQEKDKKIQDLENEKSNTNDKVKEIQDKMSNLEKELKDKMDELDKINKQLNENEKARKDLEEKLKEELSKPESEQDPEVIEDLKSKLEDNKAERDDLLARKQKLIEEINELLKQKESLEKAIESALNGECGSCTDKPNGGKDDNNSSFNPWSNKDLYDWNKGYYGDSGSKGDKGKSGDLKYVDSKKDDKADKSQDKDTIKSNTGILPPRTTGQPQLGNRESTGIADYMTVFKFDSNSYQNYINDKYISKVEMYDEVGSIKPFISNDRTMLPIRYVAEALGMEVKWDQATRTATFTNKAGNNALNVGSVTINAKTLEMRNQYQTVIPVDSKPILRNGRFYVSITNIIKAFGGTHGTVEDGMRNTIEWDKNNSRVLIYKNSR